MSEEPTEEAGADAGSERPAEPRKDLKFIALGVATALVVGSVLFAFEYSRARPDYDCNPWFICILTCEMKGSSLKFCATETCPPKFDRKTREICSEHPIPPAEELPEAVKPSDAQ